jgi:biopolymer transport protein ExbD
MAAALRTDDTQPMMEMNTTPLIDVMLVLLIMFIITIPLQSHAVKMDLPRGIVLPKPDPVKNKVVITADGRILWNGVAVGMDGLRYELGVTQGMSPQPELQLQPDATARYALVDEVLAETKRARVSSMGFVGNERYQQF